MKKYLIYVVIFFIGCTSPVKEVDSSNNLTTDPASGNIEQLKEITLPVGSYYFKWNVYEPLAFFYFSNDHNCIKDGVEYSYTLDSETGLITLKKDNEYEYYKFLSGDDLGEIYSYSNDMEKIFYISNNLKNGAFCIVKMSDTGSFQFSDTFLYVLKPQNDWKGSFTNWINIGIKSEKSNIVAEIPHVDLNVTAVENKLNYLSEFGVERVKALLEQQSQYSYDDLLVQFSNIRKIKSRLETSATVIKDKYTNVELNNIAILLKIFNYKKDVLLLKHDVDSLNMQLDKEVLPLSAVLK